MDIGSKILVDEKHHDVMDTYTEEIKTAREGIDHSSRMLMYKRKEMFAFLKEVMPETKKYTFIYNHETRCIKITGLEEED